MRCLAPSRVPLRAAARSRSPCEVVEAFSESADASMASLASCQSSSTVRAARRRPGRGRVHAQCSPSRLASWSTTCTTSWTPRLVQQRGRPARLSDTHRVDVRRTPSRAGCPGRRGASERDPRARICAASRRPWSCLPAALALGRGSGRACRSRRIGPTPPVVPLVRPKDGAQAGASDRRRIGACGQQKAAVMTNHV